MQTIIPYIYLLGMIVSVTCIFVVIYQRPSREQNVATMIAVGGALIWTGYWLEIQATSIEMLMIGTKMNYAGATSVYFFIILFCVKYFRVTKYDILVKILAVISVFFVIVTVTFEMHPFFYKSFYMDTSGTFPDLVKDYGFLHTAYLVMIVGYSMTAVGIIINEMRRKADKWVDFGNNLALICIVLIPSACFLLDKAVDAPMELAPLGLFVADGFLIYLIGGSKICDMNVLAREYIFESIDDAIVVVDRSLHYKESNKVARELYTELEDAIVGDSIHHACPEIDGMILKQSNSSEVNYIEKSGKVFRVRLKEVRDRGNIGGYVVWLEDVTAQKNSMKLLENYQRDLENEVNRKTSQLKKMQEQMINGFSAIVENKNLVTGGHVQRTSGYVEAIARELTKEHIYDDVLTESYREKLRLVAPLHDIGKVSIPDHILDKPAKLTTEEFEVIKTHSENGAKIIEKTMSESDDEEYYEMAKQITRYHHEKWNGRGYPAGLAGERIPLNARIMAVADVFDALVSERPYKRAFSFEEAFDIISSESGEHFDPKVVSAFLNIRDEIECLYHESNICTNIEA